MEIFLTTGNVTFALGIIGIIFTVYNYFRTPQEDLEKKQALAEKDLSGKSSILAQKELENKSSLLAQQVHQDQAQTERRFSEISTRMDTALSLAQNHIHTVDIKVDNLTAVVGEMSKEVVKLSTIINERIPCKPS